MARSSHFEPETVAPSDIDRDLARRDKQELSARPASHGETDIHYGKRFAETEAILKARTEERAAADLEQREASEAPDMHLGSTEDQMTPSAGPPATGAVASEAGMPGLENGSRGDRRRHRRRHGSAARRDETPPLGATSAEELPLAAEQTLAETPAELLGAYVDQVLRSVRGVGEAARQLGSAGREVVGLPLEALRVAVRVGRSWLGRSPRRA
ncbi:MAG TPA: hypothetical protein VFN91_07095 [Myxococcaceae bacterium]|nr:hypothetical protein [Myxococcaceae bacterium]